MMQKAVYLMLYLHFWLLSIKVTPVSIKEGSWVTWEISNCQAREFGVHLFFEGGNAVKYWSEHMNINCSYLNCYIKF